jgi:HPt (histidine-containing phosphotransfer) domain-containing protein
VPEGALSGGHDDVQAALAVLRTDYAARLPALIQSLLDLVEEAGERPGVAEEARLLAHRLRGTAGSYGFVDVSEAAGRIEDAIEAGELVSPALRSYLAALAPQAEGSLIRGSSK